MIYVIYYLASGYVTSVKRIQEGMEVENAGAGEEWMVIPESVTPSEVYVSNGAVVARPTMPLSVSNSSIAPDAILTISGIPEGAELWHPDGVDIVVGGTVEWSTPVPGTYRFTFEKFPFIEQEVTVEVKA